MWLLLTYSIPMFYVCNGYAEEIRHQETTVLPIYLFSDFHMLNLMFYFRFSSGAFMCVVYFLMSLGLKWSLQTLYAFLILQASVVLFPLVCCYIHIFVFKSSFLVTPSLLFHWPFSLCWYYVPLNSNAKRKYSFLQEKWARRTFQKLGCVC